MFRLTKRVESLLASEIHDMMRRDAITLIDVREPNEFATGHVAKALNFPLSRFDPTALPQEGGPIVLYCAVGKRSAMAAEACKRAEVPIAGHMEGGLSEWTRIGLPLVI
jgi:rhodanese-related sulfurtransferase